MQRRAVHLKIRPLLVATLLLVVVSLPAGAQQWTTSGNNIYNANSGNVGVGTTNPLSKFEVAGSTTNSSGKFGSYEIQSYAVGNSWLTDNIYYNGGFFFRSAGYGTLSYFYNGSFAIRTTAVSGSAGAAAVPIQRFYVQPDGAVALGGNQIAGSLGGAAMIVTGAGTVGIGVANPQATLDVAGNINVSGNINAKYQDFAEWVPASRKMDAGTVVVLDPARSNEVMPSKQAYDTRAAGVVSKQPGILLGEPSESKVQVATSGRVRVKVDATKNPINIGDLLVTSDTPGMAMKSVAVDLGGVSIHRPGTLIGKALEPLDKGEGEILVLLSLQ